MSLHLGPSPRKEDSDLVLAVPPADAEAEKATGNRTVIDGFRATIEAGKDALMGRFTATAPADDVTDAPIRAEPEKKKTQVAPIEEEEVGDLVAQQEVDGKSKLQVISGASKAAATEAIRDGIVYGTKGVVQTAANAYALKQGVQNIAQPIVEDAAILAVAKTREAYEHHVSEETRTKISDQATQAKATAAEGLKTGALFAAEQASSAYETYQETREFVRVAAKEGFEQLPEETKEQVREQQQKAEELREEWKAKIMDATRETRKTMVHTLAEHWKSALFRDPDIPRPVYRGFTRVYDEVFIDIEKEVDRFTEEQILVPVKQQEESKSEGCHWPWYYLRVFILYTKLPFNRTFWGKIRNVWWWLLMIITMIPVYCTRVGYFAIVLLCILFPGPPDQFMLTEYIMMLKGSQVLTGGVVSSLLANGTYYVCHRSLDLKYCIANFSPWRAEGDLLWFQVGDFLASSILVWIAFLNLPRSVRKDKKLIGRKKDDEPVRKIFGCIRRPGESRGGRLYMMMKYDFACFLLSIFVFGIMAGSRVGLESIKTDDILFDDYKQGIHEDLYWTRCLYAYLSAPFVIFLLAPVRRVLTHCRPTGFDSRGEVQFSRCRTKEEKEASAWKCCRCCCKRRRKDKDAARE